LAEVHHLTKIKTTIDSNKENLPTMVDLTYGSRITTVPASKSPEAEEAVAMEAISTLRALTRTTSVEEEVEEATTSVAAEAATEEDETVLITTLAAEALEEAAAAITTLRETTTITMPLVTRDSTTLTRGRLVRTLGRTEEEVGAASEAASVTMTTGVAEEVEAALETSADAEEAAEVALTKTGATWRTTASSSRSERSMMTTRKTMVTTISI
jgi:hypothetical protein